MYTIRNIPDRRTPRLRNAKPDMGYTIPLTERRQVPQSGWPGPREQWRHTKYSRTYPAVHGSLRHVAALVLWLIVVMAVILLFAEIAR
jgi:hypothetical protein